MNKICNVTEFTDQFCVKLVPQLIHETSSALQTVLKCFNGTIISKVFVSFLPV